MSVASAFGKVIKKWRTARDLSQSELAAKASLDRTFISLLERGERQPTLTTIFSICKVLKVAPSDLVGQTERALRTRRGNASPRHRL